MQKKGIVLKNVSDLYHVEIENEDIYICNARGKFKNNNIKPVAGDNVEIEISEKEEKQGIIVKIEDRINYIKRPKMSNLSQIIFVVSMDLPKPDLELLDKQLIYAEMLKVKPIICLNKIDLVSKEETEKIEKIYKKIGYTVLKTNAKENKGVDKIKLLLKNNITAFSGNSGVRKIYINK